MKLKWVRLNSRFLLKRSWYFTSIIYSVIGIIAVWCSLDGVFSVVTPIWCKLLFSILIFLTIYILTFLVTSYWYYKHDSICVIEKGNGKKVFVQYGDFIKEIKDCKERKNFIIPANRCFDTIVDDRIISANTIHGQFLKYLYSINSFAPHSLSSQIERALQGMDRTELSQNEKPNGNLLRYPVGTVVDIGSHNNSHYFMLGFTTFDSNLTAHASKEEFVLAIQKLIEFCNCHSQGYPVVLPLIGSGLSRMNISKNVALRYIVRAFEINNDIINCDFHIIVWDKDKDNTIITNLK